MRIEFNGSAVFEHLQIDSDLPHSLRERIIIIVYICIIVTICHLNDLHNTTCEFASRDYQTRYFESSAVLRLTLKLVSHLVKLLL